MTNNKLIKFLCYQLTSNEQNIKNFNSIDYDFISEIEEGEVYFEVSGQPFNSNTLTVDDIIESHILCEKFIRTCLSHVNGEAVLGLLEGKEIEAGVTRYTGELKGQTVIVDEPKYVKLSYILYSSFDYPLQNGKPLDEALQALHEKMLELVPEYVEFINSNK
jgi:hypothetical protein